MKDKLQSKQHMGIPQRKEFIEFFKDTSGEYTAIYEVKIPNAGTFDVYYTMKGGQVTSMELDAEKSFTKSSTYLQIQMESWISNC